MGFAPLQVSNDDRIPNERLGRKALERVADLNGIEYPVGLPKKIWRGTEVVGGLVMLLQSHGVDVTRPDSGVEWEEFPQKGEDGNFSHNENYPRKALHQTARDQTDSNAELLRRLDTIKDKDDEILDLRSENERLRSEMDARLAALETKTEPQGFPIEKLLPWQIRQMAKSQGIETKGRSDEDIRRDLTNSQDTSE